MGEFDLSNRGFSQVKDIVRDISVSRLGQYTKLDTRLEEVKGRSFPVLGHWMALNLCSGQDVKIIFKVHFDTNIARQLCQKAFDEEWQKISLDYAHDFMKEYCNLVSGKLKQVFNSRKIQIGIGLPFVTRGFDDVFFEAINGSRSQKYMWKISTASGVLHCSVDIEIHNDVDLDNIEIDDSQEGEVEFI